MADNKSTEALNKKGTLGAVRIADEVVSIIAGLAATEVKGTAIHGGAVEPGTGFRRTQSGGFGAVAGGEFSQLRAAGGSAGADEFSALSGGRAAADVYGIHGAAAGFDV